jgi:cytochrome b561
MVLYYLRLRRQSPQHEEYNPLQRLAYTGVFVILTPLVLLSGMAMSPQLNVAFNWLPAAFGGRQAARTVHFVLAFAFLLFTFGHVFMVLTTGMVNNMRCMLSGWYREKTAPTSAHAVLVNQGQDLSLQESGQTADGTGAGSETAATAAIVQEEPQEPASNGAVLSRKITEAKKDG